MKINNSSELNHNQSLQFISYDVSFEPLNIYNRSKELEQKSFNIIDLMGSNTKEALKQLLVLVETYPSDPVFAGYLAVAYRLEDDSILEKSTIINNYKKFPDYLFARCMYAELCLCNHDLEAAAKAINNKFEIQLLYPERSVFHISEIIIFYTVCVKYFGDMGNLDQAALYIDVLEQIDNENPVIENLKEYLFYCDIFEKMKKMLSNEPKRRMKRIAAKKTTKANQKTS